MKKLCFLFAVLLLSALLFALPTAAADPVVYLANGGDGDGSSAAAPLGSLNDAYAALGDGGGTIVVCGAYTLGNTSPMQLPAHTGKVTFTSLYDDVDYRTSGAELTFNGTSFAAFNGPTDFDDLNMHVTGSAAGICANFNDMTIGHGVEILGAKATTYYMYLIGGPNNNSAVAPLAAGKTFRLSVYSGKFHTMSGFSRNNTNASHLGTAVVTIGGDADVSAFCGGPLSSGAKGGTAVINLEDAAAIKTFYLGGYNCAAMNGDLTLNVSGTAKVTTISNYNETYFATTQKILNTVGNSFSLPTGYADIFDRITVDGVQVKPATDASVFYVCDGGTGDGTSALSPAGALADAYAALPYGGTVVVCGAYTLGNTSTLTLPAISGEMTITSRFGGVDYRENGAKLIFNGTNFLKLSSATVFDALTMTLDGSMAGICANFHPVTVTESVSVIRTSGSTAYSMIFVVGTSGDKTNSLGAGEILEMNINGGKFTSCTAFTRQVATSNAGTVILNIGGNADVRDLVGGALSTTAARAGSAVINLSGNAHVTNFYLGGYSSAGMQGDTVVNIGGDVSITKIANYDENFYPASEKYLNLFTDSATLPSGFADCFDYVTTASENATVKFVRGEATGSGATPFAPTGSIASAYAALPAGGKIVVMGGATFENASTLQLPAHTGTVTLTSTFGGMDFRTLADAKVGYTGTAFVCFNGDTILDDITVDIGSFASEGFCFNFHNGTLG
ncbi:MAG: hypothetical protein IJS44_03520, partial [Clostridia bacterium]|nr:hypothetical protein [Clostridia bacterium]